MSMKISMSIYNKLQMFSLSLIWMKVNFERSKWCSSSLSRTFCFDAMACQLTKSIHQIIWVLPLSHHSKLIYKLCMSDAFVASQISKKPKLSYMYFYSEKYVKPTFNLYFVSFFSLFHTFSLIIFIFIFIYLSIVHLFGVFVRDIPFVWFGAPNKQWDRECKVIEFNNVDYFALVFVLFCVCCCFFLPSVNF